MKAKYTITHPSSPILDGTIVEIKGKDTEDVADKVVELATLSGAKFTLISIK